MVNESTTSIPPSGTKRPSFRGKQIYLQMIVGAIILLCGIVIGSGTTLMLLKDKIGPGPRPPLPDIVEDIQSRYNLTPEQVEKVEEILERRRETMHAQFEELRTKMEAEFQGLSTEMKGVLSPEQYERWENDFKSRRRGPGKFGPGRNGPGRPGPGRFGSGRRERGGNRPPRSDHSEPNSAPE